MLLFCIIIFLKHFILKILQNVACNDVALNMKHYIITHTHNLFIRLHVIRHDLWTFFKSITAVAIPPVYHPLKKKTPLQVS